MNRTRSKKYFCESDTRMTVVRIDFKKNVKKVERGHVRGTKRRKRKESKLHPLKQNAFEITSFVSIFLHRYQNIISCAYFFNRLKG